MSKRFHRLSTRIVAQFCLFTVFISAVYVLFSFLLMYNLEDGFLQKEINTEAEVLKQTFLEQGIWAEPSKTHMKIYLSAQDFPQDLKKAYELEMGRQEFFGEDNKHYHITTIDAQGVEAFLVAEVSDQLLVRPMRDGVLIFMGITCFVLTILACLMAWFLGRRTAKPLSRLTDLVHEVELAEVPEHFAGEFPRNEIGQLAATLEQSFNQIKAAMSRERAFTRDVSHELRTPVAIIKNSVEVMRLSDLSEGSKKTILRIEDACIQMEQTVNTLLMLARAEHTEGEEAEVNLLELTERVVVNQAHLIKGKSIEVVADPSLNQTVLSQPGMLKVLLDNLIGNAFQYTEEGSVTIRYQDHALEVSDTGPGIDPQIYQNVTKPAVKGRESVGFGFGLSLVKRLCEQQGWRLTVDSKLGTSVRVFFTQT